MTFDATTHKPPSIVVLYPMLTHLFADASQQLAQRPILPQTRIQAGHLLGAPASLCGNVLAVVSP